MALLTNWDNGGDEEWEICNDNGFVYKRRRRHLPSDVDDSLRSPSPSSSSYNRDAESRRARKKQTLLHLRDKYSKELQQWEQLSSTLALINESPPPPNSPPPAASTTVTARSTEIEELLLLQVEAQESAIEKARELCDYVDAVCDAEEERMGEVLMDLPVWGSPGCLVAALLSSSLQKKREGETQRKD